MPVFVFGQVRYVYLQILQDSFHTSVVTCNKEQKLLKKKARADFTLSLS